MINNILRDLINTRDVVLFINDILVGTENKKKHDEIVEKVLRRIEKNNLYVKFEKYVQKVKEINFPGLVMGEEDIKIQ